MQIPKLPNPLQAYGSYAKAFDRVTGASQMAKDAAWAIRNPIGRMQNKGPFNVPEQMAIPFGPGGPLGRSLSRLQARGMTPEGIAAYQGGQRLAKEELFLPLVKRGTQQPLEPGAIQGFMGASKMKFNRGKGKIGTTNYPPISPQQAADQLRYPTQFDARFTALGSRKGVTASNIPGVHHGEINDQLGRKLGLREGHRDMQDDIQYHIYETVRGADGAPSRMGLGHYNGTRQGAATQNIQPTKKQQLDLIRMVRDMGRAGIEVGKSEVRQLPVRGGQAGQPSMAIPRGSAQQRINAQISERARGVGGAASRQSSPLPITSSMMDEIQAGFKSSPRLRGDSIFGPSKPSAPRPRPGAGYNERLAARTRGGGRK